MRLRKVTIKNEPKIITSPATVTKSKISDVLWRFVISKIPVVSAEAPKAEQPQLTAMRYTDLPLYVPIIPVTERTKDHEIKVLHRKIDPYVTEYRKLIFNSMRDYMSPINEEVCKIFCKVSNTKSKFKEYMRHPDNLQMRKAIVASGTVAGLALGARGPYLTRRIFWGAAGALFTGWLCFPKETDVAVRQISYKFATTSTTLLSKFCNTTYRIEKDRLPCFRDICIPTEKYHIVRKDCNKKELPENQTSLNQKNENERKP